MPIAAVGHEQPIMKPGITRHLRLAGVVPAILALRGYRPAQAGFDSVNLSGGVVVVFGIV